LWVLEAMFLKITFVIFIIHFVLGQYNIPQKSFLLSKINVLLKCSFLKHNFRIIQTLIIQYLFCGCGYLQFPPKTRKNMFSLIQQASWHCFVNYFSFVRCIVLYNTFKFGAWKRLKLMTTLHLLPHNEYTSQKIIKLKKYDSIVPVNNG